MLQNTISAVVALDDDVDRMQLEATLPGTDQLSVNGLVHGFDFDSVARDQSAQVLLVVCRDAQEDAARLIGRWSTDHPDRPVVALCEEVPDYFVHALLGAGADDVVRLPESPEHVLFTIEKALARHKRREVEGTSDLAPMICVLGPKGGTGKTVTATNLAVSLAQSGKQTALVDLDLQFGDVGLVLGLDPDRTSYDLATSGGVVDAEKLDAYLMTHESGLRALLAPVRPDQASGVSTELMGVVFGILRATYDVLVIDTPPDFTNHVIAAVDSSSHLCMVGMLDAVSLKNTRLGLETLDLMGYDQDSVAMVLNRANTNVGLTREDVEAVVGRSPNIFVPSDRDVPRSVNEGAPIVASRKRSPVAAAYRSLAQIYLDDAFAARNVPVPEHVDTNGNGNGQAKEAGRRRLSLIMNRGS